MTQPSCGCFAHMDMAEFAGARCEHGEHGDQTDQTDQTRVVIAMPRVLLTSASES